MRETSGEARTEAPTTKDPDSTKDLPITSTVQNINESESCDEALPPVCCTPATRCGSFLTSDGPCHLHARIGCVIRHHAGYQAVTDPTPAARGAGEAIA